ncbi:MAG: hypothetical protein GY940_22110 [bacterium]|nr:hypothetical protein [bacterium]
MKIEDHIRTSHKQLAATGDRFIEFIQKNPEMLDRSGFRVLEGKDAVGILQPWPAFINQQTRSRMAEASTSVFQLIKSIPKRIFNNDPDKISRYFETPVSIVKMQMEGADEEHLENLLARGDFIFSPSGMKCLEYNVSANIGGFQVSFWEPMYANIPIIAKFLNQYHIKPANQNVLALLAGHFLRRAVNKFSGRDSEINIAMVIPKYIEGVMVAENKYMDRIHKQLLEVHYNMKGNVIFCDWQHLKRSGDTLFFRDKRIHIVMEMYHGLLPDDIHTLYKQGNICLYNGPVTKLLSNKLTLAALSEYEDSERFSPKERETIKKYIPWTRKVVPGEVSYGTDRVKLEEFIFSNREKLVIKPPLGNSGEGISIGKNTPLRQWETVINAAFKEGGWLIQEYIESDSYLYQTGTEGCAEHIAAWGLFVFGSTYSGGWVRVLPKENKNGVINAIQGAEESVVLEINEE